MPNNDLFFFEETIRFLAAGICERERIGTTEEFRFSSKLRAGISRLAVLAAQYSGKSINFHETMFIIQYASKPLKEWFKNWDNEFQQLICQSEYYMLGEFIVLSDNARFELTDDCIELLDVSEDDLAYGEEQKNVFKKMVSLTPELYSEVREFIVTNPVCDDSALREFRLKYPDTQAIGDILDFSYEKVNRQTYRCPHCGWTMTFVGLQASCCNRSCTQTPLSEADIPVRDILPAGICRLRRGVMRYMAIPGKLELQIRDNAEKLGYATVLYPEKDKYDIRISGAGRTIAVDAKTHHNPWLLKKQIEADFAFRNTGCLESYYVVPDEYEKIRNGFCSIAGAGCSIKCITVKQLMTILKGGRI